MAMKSLSKLEKEYQDQAKKLKALEDKKKSVEEEYMRDLGKIYFKIQRKKNKDLTLAKAHSQLKEELQSLQSKEKMNSSADKMDENG